MKDTLDVDVEAAVEFLFCHVQRGLFTIYSISQRCSYRSGGGLTLL